jgi:1-acyl-sn-glycerol-3-phosphate acyltransferase
MKVILRLFYRVKWVGLENISLTGAVFLAAKHTGAIDILLLGTCTRRHISFIVKEELANHPIARWWLNEVDTIPIKRGEKDNEAFIEVTSRLKSEDIIAIYPEGTRIPGRKVGEIQKGASLMSLRSRTDPPIVPIGIAVKWRSPFYHIVFYCTEPFRPSDCNKKTDEITKNLSTTVQAATDLAWKELDKTL